MILVAVKPVTMKLVNAIQIVCSLTLFGTSNNSSSACELLRTLVKWQCLKFVSCYQKWSFSFNAGAHMEKSSPQLRHEHSPIKHESVYKNENSEEEGEKEKNREEVDIDGFLYMSGECGLYQVYIVTLMMIISFPLGYPPMAFYFIGYDPTWVLTKDISDNSELPVVKNTHVKIHSRDDMRRCKLNRTEWEYNFDKTTMTTDVRIKFFYVKLAIFYLAIALLIFLNCCLRWGYSGYCLSHNLNFLWKLSPD